MTGVQTCALPICFPVTICGVIDLELGSVYLRLGSQVTVVEFMDKIIPTMDGALSKELQKVLKKQGMKFMLSTGGGEFYLRSLNDM